MKKTDQQLGMDRDITRRDFLNDSSLAALGLGVLGSGVGQSAAAGDGQYYPPTRNGLRGAHPGSFEAAHAMSRPGVAFGPAEDTDEKYDLVIVGGGISGLAAAWFYRKECPQARILILENHDDFGGHAKRNEFHQGGVMRLAWGGVFNLEYPEFSETVNELMDELGVDIQKLLRMREFDYSWTGVNGPGIFFDAETYGRDVLVTGCALRESYLGELERKADQFPLSEESIESLKRFALKRTDVRDGMSEVEIEKLMHGIPYTEFLTRHGGLTNEAAGIFVKTTEGFWGVPTHSLSVSEARWAGLPMGHLLGEEPRQRKRDGFVSGAAMFPDGNASIARLLVRALIPGVAKGSGMDDIVTARFDYSKLDRSCSDIRLRLNSTVIGVTEENGQVAVNYVENGQVKSVSGKQSVLACYHQVIPHICPQLPVKQKEAQLQQVKTPLVLTNVLLRNTKAADRIGISGSYCPGRIFGANWLVRGINTEDFRHSKDDDGSVCMMFWGMMNEPEQKGDVRTQYRAGAARMMALSFEDYEREVRTILDGLLGPAGFDVKRDVLAITVNRWPHGYAYEYLELWDPEWAPGQAPHEIARKPFGNIAIANSDAGASAYTHAAIDQAWRAVNELTA